MNTTPCLWRGDQALRLSNQFLSVVVTTWGAQIASLQGVLADGSPGPEALWQPPWPAERPDRAGPAWGPAAEAPLLANICGWNCCLDRFGLRPDDGGRPLHGEAGVLPWQLAADGEGIRARLRLPLAGLEVERLISLDGSRLLVDTTVSAIDGEDHEIEWCEHISLGDPLIDGAEVRCQAASAVLHPDAGAHAASRFSAAPGSPVPVAEALAIPPRSATAAGDIVALALEEGAWEVANPQLGWALSAQFDHRLFPWLCLWTEHQGRHSQPWGGVTRVRGMEASSKPFPEGLPPAERYPNWQGRPTRLLLSADTPLRSRMALNWQPLRGL